MAEDPFPQFHLTPLTFELSDLGKLTTAQLALARYSSDYDTEDLALEKKIVRAFRQRREKNRSKIGSTPIGIFSSERTEDNYWPWFELADLSFALDGLESLTSAQLALIPFHPQTSKDLLPEAEDIFFARRERDFAAGRALSELSTTAAPVKPAAPIQSTAASSSSTTPSSVSTPSAPKIQPFSLPTPPATEPTPTLAKITTEPPKKAIQQWLAEDDSMEPSPAVTSTPPRSSKPEERSRPRSDRERDDKDRSRSDGRPVERERSRDCDRGRGDRERDRERERGREPERERERERTKPERLSDRLNPLPPTPMDVDRNVNDRKRERSPGMRNGEPSPRRRRSSITSLADRDRDRGDQREREREKDRERDRREREKVEERDRTRYGGHALPPPPPRDLDISHPPTNVEPRNYGTVPAHLASSFRSGGIIRADDWIPIELEEAIANNVIFVTNLVVGQKVEEIRKLLLTLSQIAPLAIKLNPYGSGTHGQVTGKPVANCFVAYLLEEDARIVTGRLNGVKFAGEFLGAEKTHKKDGTMRHWKWVNVEFQFRKDWELGKVRLPKREVKDARDVRDTRGDPSRPPAPSAFALPSSSPSIRQSPVPYGPKASQQSEGRVALPPQASLPSGPRQETPQHLPQTLASSLWQLFVSNLPEHVTIAEMREVFDDCEGLLGISLGTPNRKWHNCAGWLVFYTKEERNKAQAHLEGRRFPNCVPTLYLEPAEHGKIKATWEWGDMSKAFRDKHKPRAPPPQSSPPPPQVASRGPQFASPSAWPSSVPRSTASAPTPAIETSSRNKIHPSRLGLVPTQSSADGLSDVLATLIPIDSLAPPPGPRPAPSGANAYSPLSGQRARGLSIPESIHSGAGSDSGSTTEKNTGGGSEKLATPPVVLPTGPRGLSIKGANKNQDSANKSPDNRALLKPALAEVAEVVAPFVTEGDSAGGDSFLMMLNKLKSDGVFDHISASTASTESATTGAESITNESRSSDDTLAESEDVKMAVVKEDAA